MKASKWGHVVASALILLSAIATAANVGLSQMAEFQAQNFFFQLRGSVTPPPEIVILAIDDESLSQGQYYRVDPQRYVYLEPIQSWPFNRAAYAQVIERLMAAGARSVAVDVLFAEPSSYGVADDKRLYEVLELNSSSVVLAAQYESNARRGGTVESLSRAARSLAPDSVAQGSVNFPLELDGRVHRFAAAYLQGGFRFGAPERNTPPQSEIHVPSFEQAVVGLIRSSLPEINTGLSRIYEIINFYGHSGTFEQIPFAHVLDPNNWNSYLQGGKYFQGKIVLIGGTAPSLQDYHNTPFGLMSGVEIHANAIATLLEDCAIADIPHSKLRGGIVLSVVLAAAFTTTRLKRGLSRLIMALVISTSWYSLSYSIFVHARLILPAAVPSAAIALLGLTYFASGAAQESDRKRRLRSALAAKASSPVVQAIIKEQDDLQDLLRVRSLSMAGTVKGSRYKIIRVLGSGGFGETYVAEDTQRPGNPLCVVKQLRPQNDDPKHLQLAMRLFELEAQTLERLGHHDQIPQLFAYFEEAGEFYLVQELIVGQTLSSVLRPGVIASQAVVVQMLRDLLQVLEFVHAQGVIHRDIKPSNIIRRHSDGKLVLIDFGAVKEVAAQSDGETKLTASIGTQGYAPPEQMAGRVRFNSDIYAVGMFGLKALTGLAPQELKTDTNTGELLWNPVFQITPQLAAIINKMVRYDYTSRYQSASEVLSAIGKV